VPLAEPSNDRIRVSGSEVRASDSRTNEQRPPSLESGSGARRAADESGHQAVGDTQPGSQPRGHSVTGHRHDHAQQFGPVHRVVTRWDTVSLGHDARTFVRHDAMREQAVIACEHRDLAPFRLAYWTTADGQSSPGHNAGIMLEPVTRTLAWPNLRSTSLISAILERFARDVTTAQVVRSCGGWRGIAPVWS